MTLSEVTTICPYCGTGCSLNLVVRDGRVIGTSPYFRSPVNGGRLCPKGTYCHQFIHHAERLKKPLIRKGDIFYETDWDVAFEYMVSRLGKHLPEEMAVLTSARCSNEDNYIAMKFARGVLKTRHVDHCARLCHSSTMAGLLHAFGNGSMTNSIPDIGAADCILCLGSNTFEQHPLVGRQIIRARQRGATLIYADPRYTPTAIQADIFLQYYSGSDVLILNAIMGEIIRNGDEDKVFIRNRTTGYESLRKLVLNPRYEPDSVAELAGVPAGMVCDAAERIGKAERCCILYAMGTSQHVTGIDNVHAIANLMLLTGNLGRPGTGVNALRGQNNVQGACDVGCLPDYYPGYIPVTDRSAHQNLEQIWGFPDGISEPHDGYGITTLFEKLRCHAPEIRVLYLIGVNPLVSEPNLAAVEAGLKKLDLLIVQDIFFTETCQQADVVLPAACFAEKDGTQTNTERRVQRIRKAVHPPGEAKSDWMIISELAARMGYGDQFSYPSAKEVFTEICRVIPQYRGMTYEQVGLPDGICWPCPDPDHPGTPVLYEEFFDTPDGKGHFCPVEWKEPPEKPDKEFPFRLTTGRVIWHGQSGTMTRRSESLADEITEGYIEVNGEDAAPLGIRDGDRVRITSRRGSVECLVRITRDIRRGMVFMPFHFAETAANRLTSDVLDPVAGIPEYKATVVSIGRIGRSGL